MAQESEHVQKAAEDFIARVKALLSAMGESDAMVLEFSNKKIIYSDVTEVEIFLGKHSKLTLRLYEDRV